MFPYEVGPSLHVGLLRTALIKPRSIPRSLKEDQKSARPITNIFWSIYGTFTIVDDDDH